MIGRLLLLGSSAVASLLAGCVEERCYQDGDCEGSRRCVLETGACVDCLVWDDCAPGHDCVEHVCVEGCRDDDPCGDGICSPEGVCVPGCPEVPCEAGFVCNEGNPRCVPEEQEPITCPGDMVPVAELFCLDRYEASRPDATAASPGADESEARSVPGVLPWRVASNEVAAAACEAVGKRLCTASEWGLACEGPEGWMYTYGDDYDVQTCNGIETYGRSAFRLAPTGAFPQCTNAWGAYDLSGNVWEHTAGGNDKTVRGGAFNCSDPRLMHKCGYVPGNWEPSALGFRCCQDPDRERPPTPPPDAGPGADADAGVDAGPADTGGCISEDAGGGAAADGGTDAATDTLGDATSGKPDVESPSDGGGSATDSGADSGADSGTDSGTDTGADAAAGPCPPDMVDRVTFCIDRHEASRSDATEFLAGVSDIPSSRPGVLPWFVRPWDGRLELDAARAACARAGKRLCTPDEWFSTCTGPRGLVYTYGDDYEADACNGIDAFCRCDTPGCAWMDECPTPHCRNQRSPDGDLVCLSSFHVMPTGSFERCTNEHGVSDINGNVWEVVDYGDDRRIFRGGAYNCGDSERLHRCDHIGDWEPSAQGFRCCKDR